MRINYKIPKSPLKQLFWSKQSIYIHYMTTLKEKAALLILTYMALGVRKDQAKEYALAAVEFARDEFKYHCVAEIGTEGTPDDHFNTIKSEIEKL